MASCVQTLSYKFAYYFYCSACYFNSSSHYFHRLKTSFFNISYCNIDLIDRVALVYKKPTLKISVPRIFAPLLAPSRYKGAYGGRGSGKSHHFAEKVLVEAISAPKRIVCIREVQKSIRESVKRLLEDKIEALNLGGYFHVLEQQIRGINGSRIIFQGMQDHTAESIKSLEGYDIAWVEEAQSLSERSLRLLRPTIRKENSELWFTWNPLSADDAVDAFLRGEHTPPDSIVVKANWSDNPWFPQTLELERQFDKTTHADIYDHIWEGEYWKLKHAQVFNNRVEIRSFDPPPENTNYLFGADWGFANDPTVLIRCFIANDTLYIDHEAYGFHVEIDALPALFDKIPEARRFPIKADSARPETISYMARQGFNIRAASKWQGSVEDGLAYMKGFQRIVIHERCPEIAREFRLYSYKIDSRSGDILPLVCDAFNHGIDATRYALDGYIKHKGFIFLQK